MRTLESLPASKILGPKSTFSKLLALTSAAFSQRAAEYNLQLSFLLKGGRGIGKFTVISWVSQRLGLNLQEVCLLSSIFVLFYDHTLGQLPQYRG